MMSLLIYAYEAGNYVSIIQEERHQSCFPSWTVNLGPAGTTLYCWFRRFEIKGHQMASQFEVWTFHNSKVFGGI